MVEFGSLRVNLGSSTLRAPHSHNNGLNTIKIVYNYNHNYFESMEIIVHMFKLDNQEYDANRHAHYLSHGLLSIFCPTNSLVDPHWQLSCLLYLSRWGCFLVGCLPMGKLGWEWSQWAIIWHRWQIGEYFPSYTTAIRRNLLQARTLPQDTNFKEKSATIDLASMWWLHGSKPLRMYRRFSATKKSWTTSTRCVKDHNLRCFRSTSQCYWKCQGAYPGLS